MRMKVRRQRLGTTIAGFSTGDLVEKIRGNYNIVENEINFIEAPLEKIQLVLQLILQMRETLKVLQHHQVSKVEYLQEQVLWWIDMKLTHNYLFDDLTQGFNG